MRMPINSSSILNLHQSLDVPGVYPVNSSVTCVLTRFRLRNPYYLLLTYLDYRHLVQELTRVNTPGLLRSVFFIENFTTCYSFSIWDSRADIPTFGTKVSAHIDAARRVFGRLSKNEKGYLQIWSTKWKLASVSNNLIWDNFDLQALIVSTNK